MSEVHGKTIEEVAEQVSFAVAKRLVDVFPGTRKYVPHKIDEKHELAIIGIHYARALVREFAGSRLDIPMSMMSPKQRQILILKLTKENMRVADIALRAGCTETRVYQVRREAKENGFSGADAPPRQASLF